MEAFGVNCMYSHLILKETDLQCLEDLGMEAGCTQLMDQAPSHNGLVSTINKITTEVMVPDLTTRHVTHSG